VTERKSITPTYNGAETGPRYHVTSRINSHTVTFQHPADDPFVRHVIHICWLDRLKSLFLRRLDVEVIVGGDAEIIEDVMELNSDYLGPMNSTRRKAFQSELNDAIGRFADEQP
jgi:hypothetical protein